MSVHQCRRLNLPTIQDARGNLTFAEGEKDIPFAIARIYFLYDVPAGGARGAHGHKALEQVFVALGGTFDLLVDDGTEKRAFTLGPGSDALYMPKMMWRDLTNFSRGATCLVLASARYDESDYYRDYQEFLAAASTAAQSPSGQTR